MNKIKKITIVASLLTLFSAAGYTAFGGSVRSHEMETTYYSDAAKTQEVGALIFTCDRFRPYSYGQRTEHFTVDSIPCHR